MNGVNKKPRFHVAIDRGWMDMLHELRNSRRQSVRSLVEHALASTYAPNKKGKMVEVYEL